jgi:hypothetical protein
MDEFNSSDRRVTLFASWAIAGGIPVIAVYMGFVLTPPAKYNEVMGVLIPVCVFGFGGALAAVVSFCSSLWVMRSARLKSLPGFLRVLIVLVISSSACAVAVYCGLKHMLGLTPAIY